MNFPLYIAKRYLFSKKSHNVINLISGISVIGIAFGTMAMVVVLSAFNGIEGLVDRLYSSFDADLIITPKKGKVFHNDSIHIKEIHQLEGVENVSRTIEANALIKNRSDHVIATVKGIEPSFIRMSGLDSMMRSGTLTLKRNGEPRTVIGLGIKYELGMAYSEHAPPSVRVSAPIRGKRIHKYKERAFKHEYIPVSGIFSVNVDFDSRYILVPLEFAEKMFQYEKQWTAVEVDVKDDHDLETVKDQVSKLLGPHLKVETRYEKNSLIYKTNKTEKWITFLILTFILVIATFNIIASLTMLILEKKKDIHILKGMGASSPVIQRIFFAEGMMINGLGGVIGIGVGILLCWLQMQFGLLPLEGTVVDYYPVKVMMTDLFAVLGIVLLIGLISSSIPVKLLTRKLLSDA